MNEGKQNDALPLASIIKMILVPEPMNVRTRHSGPTRRPQGLLQRTRSTEMAKHQLLPFANPFRKAQFDVPFGNPADR
jgi:hypothetical protein